MKGLRKVFCYSRSVTVTLCKAIGRYCIFIALSDRKKKTKLGKPRWPSLDHSSLNCIRRWKPHKFYLKLQHRASKDTQPNDDIKTTSNATVTRRQPI